MTSDEKEGARSSSLCSQEYVVSHVVYRKQFIESIEKGIADADSGKLYTTEEAKSLLSEKRTT